MSRLESKNILIISNEPWGEIWFSKHHYAWELSQKGNKVIFVNPTEGWKWSNLFSKKCEVKMINENLSVLNYSNLLPSFFLKVNNNNVSKRISRKLKNRGFSDFIFWTFDPIRLFDPSKLKAKKSVFHVMDKYQFVHPGEFETHRSVDVFILVSESFREYYARYNKPMLVLPHAISADELKWEEKESEKSILPFKEEKFACYIGNVDVRLDYELIRQMAERFPQIPFLFIGKLQESEDVLFRELFVLKKYSNIYSIGPVPAKSLKYYIEKADFCIAPMSKSHKGNDISHHKIFQYLIRGKAVFSMVFKEYISFSDLLYMEDDNQILLAGLDRYIESGEGQELKEKRKELASEFLFEKHFIKIEKFLENIGEK